MNPLELAFNLPEDELHLYKKVVLPKFKLDTCPAQAVKSALIIQTCMLSWQWGAETVTPAVATTPAAPTTEWGTETKEWGAETVPTTTQEWGAEDTMQPSSDWGTSVTMQDAKTGGADWA